MSDSINKKVGKTLSLISDYHSRSLNLFPLYESNTGKRQRLVEHFKDIVKTLNVDLFSWIAAVHLALSSQNKGAVTLSFQSKQTRIMGKSSERHGYSAVMQFCQLNATLYIKTKSSGSLKIKVAFLSTHGVFKWESGDEDLFFYRGAVGEDKLQDLLDSLWGDVRPSFLYKSIPELRHPVDIINNRLDRKLSKTSTE